MQSECHETNGFGLSTSDLVLDAESLFLHVLTLQERLLQRGKSREVHLSKTYLICDGRHVATVLHPAL